jgi:class 3 adenylate cyclase
MPPTNHEVNQLQAGIAALEAQRAAEADRAILDRGGRIDKPIGGAVMALWGAESARKGDG